MTDKVHTEIEKSLGQAIQAKIAVEKERDQLKQSLSEWDMLFMELDYMYGMIRQEIHEVRVLRENNIWSMEANNQEMMMVREENERLVRANQKWDEDNRTLSEQLDEALNCLKKMEEVRFTMNRLMGPKGVLEDHERYKFLL